jgi:peroxiredoxin
MSDSSRGAIIVIIIILVTIALYLAFNPGKGTSDGPGGTASGNRAPDFTATTIDGDQIKLSDYIGDKPVVIDFWATWCSPCMMELPKLQEFYAAHSGEVEIIAISTDQSGALSNVRRVVNEKGLTFPIIHDASGELSQLYPSRYIPYLVFIDKNGVKIYEATGFNENIGNEILEKFGL